MQAYTRKYTYDKMGNITQLKQTVGNTFTRNFHYDTIASSNLLHSIKKADDITNYSSFTYDVNGNKLTSGTSRNYVWDYGDQLKAFLDQTGTGQPQTYAQYIYSGGQRVKKLVRNFGGSTETTVYIDGVFEHRYNSSAQAQTVVHVGGIATVRKGHAFDSMPSTTYQLSNHLGSVNFRLDGNGLILDKEEYYPFGDSAVRTWGAKRYRYVGKEKDAESGLYYYGARYYSAWTCRFISVDPLARKFADLSPYNYAGNKPINKIDIDGLQEENRQETPNSGNSSGGGDSSDGEPGYWQGFREGLLSGVTDILELGFDAWILYESYYGFLEDTDLGATKRQEFEDQVGAAGAFALRYTFDPKFQEDVNQMFGDYFAKQLDTALGTDYEAGKIHGAIAFELVTAITTGGSAIGPKAFLNAVKEGGDALTSILRKAITDYDISIDGKKLVGDTRMYVNPDAIKITKKTNSFKVESALSSKPTRTHGYKWSDNDAIKRASDTGNPQGRFGSKEDVEYAIEQAQDLKIGERKLIEAPAGSKNEIIMPDGSIENATHIFVEVKPSGKTGSIHAFPVQSGYKITPRKRF